MTTQTIVDGVTLSAASWANDVDTATYSYLTGVAGTNTVTATGAANLALTAGVLVRYIPAATNTGATTINPTPSGGSALGAKSIFAYGAALVGGETVINVPALLMYDGTQWNLINPQPITGTFASTYTFNGSGGTSGSDNHTWQRNGKFVTLSFNAIQAATGTGSTILSSDSALPASVRPTVNQDCLAPRMLNNGIAVASPGVIVIGTNGVISIVRDGASTAFTNSATAGTATQTTVTYFTSS